MVEKGVKLVLEMGSREVFKRGGRNSSMLIGFFRKRELGAGDTGPNCLRGQKGMSSKFHSNGTESRV